MGLTSEGFLLRRHSRCPHLGPLPGPAEFRYPRLDEALWLAPDERLLLVPTDDGGEMEGLLQGALAGMTHSLVDTSHAQAAFEVSGAQATTALNTGCPLNLDPPSFPVDMCTRTVFAKAQIVLWRTGPETFRVETGRSFAPYLTQILALAARES
jgi:sarcosine oxidase subunit gamma